VKHHGRYKRGRELVYSAVSVADDRKVPPGPGTKGIDARGDAESSRARQRSRLLDSIVEIVSERGYPDAHIGEISARAGVSRATFYQLFENKQACFLAAQCALAAKLSTVTADAVAEADPERAIDAAFGALIDFAEREPSEFGLLAQEALLAGPQAVAERDRLLSELIDQVEQAQARAGRTATLPDIPSGILLGGAVRAIGIRMRSGSFDAQGLRAGLVAWVDSYRVPRRARRKDSGFDVPEPTGGKGVQPSAMAPAPLPRGRHRLPSELVVRVQRERILYATAEAIRANGYENTTVADIVATAGVSREVFYSHFRSRADAFVATHKLVFEQLMATAAGSFFASAGPWPERVWDAWTAATEFVVGAPSFAYFAFVESYALGPSINKRTDDAVLAFTVFLRGDQRQDTPAREPSASTFTAIAATVMETTASYVRDDRAAELFTLMPLMTYMILAPFLGADAAHEVVQRKARELALEGAGRGA
jgi:AcrR family transcriptional regulator